MANDLFVKNRWMLAGVFAKPAATESLLSTENKVDSIEVAPDEERATKRHKSGPSKKRLNPALI
jgi:hypothetical protein